MSDADERTEAVKTYARRLGFDLVGVTTADPLDEDGRRLSAWIADGFAGEMAYMTRDPDRRTDPRELMPGAQSVVSLGLNYYQHSDIPGEGRSGGRVARYAWGEDYHRIIEEKLKELVAFIEGLGGRCARGRGDVDHGPVLEKALARRAGMGFIGKNTLFISPRMGSWLFLAEVITDLRLIPDPPWPTDACGSCQLCLQACPTEALTEPYRLDARRCISYLTIEQKGTIPEPLRSRMGDWAFGCDLCQEVCPYNQRPTETAVERLRSDHGIGARIRPEDLLPASLKGRLALSPLLRAKRRGLSRNLAVALGNGGGPEDLAEQLSMFREEDPLVREHAAWGIRVILERSGGWPDPRMREAFQAARARETDPTVCGIMNSIDISYGIKGGS